MELICPAGTPAALRTAVDAGADAIYCGFADATNARNFPGLNFSRSEMAEGIAYAHRGGAKVLVAINTFPAAGAPALWHLAVDDAVAGVSGKYFVDKRATPSAQLTQDEALQDGLWAASEQAVAQAQR